MPSGVDAPDVIGAALMAAAGACWGAYSLAGRGSRDPLGATAGNFARAASTRGSSIRRSAGWIGQTSR
mgnify:CR=1 FL=1